MSAMTPVDQNSPLWKAWVAYQAGDSYENTRKWALYEAHVEGSLWAAFMAGHQAAEAALVAVRQERDMLALNLQSVLKHQRDHLGIEPAAPAPSAAETVIYQGRTEPQAQFRHGAVDDPHEEEPSAAEEPR